MAKAIFMPFGRKSFQQPPLAAIYQSIPDPGTDSMYMKFCLDLISMLIQAKDGLVYVDVPRFLRDHEVIISQLQAAQIYDQFKPSISSYDVGRHLSALFFIMRQLSLAEDASLMDYLSPSRRNEAEKMLKKILGLNFIKNKVKRAVSDPLQLFEGFKLFLSTLLESQNLIFSKIDAFLTLRKDLHNLNRIKSDLEDAIKREVFCTSGELAADLIHNFWPLLARFLNCRISDDQLSLMNLQFTRPVELMNVLQMFKFNSALFISPPNEEIVTAENVKQFAKNLAKELEAIKELIELNVEVSFNINDSAHSTMLGGQAPSTTNTGAIPKSTQFQQCFDPPGAARITPDQSAIQTGISTEDPSNIQAGPPLEDPSTIPVDERGYTPTGRTSNHRQLAKCMENYSIDLYNLYNKYQKEAKNIDLSSVQFYIDSFKNIEKDFLKIRNEIPMGSLQKILVGDPAMLKDPLELARDTLQVLQRDKYTLEESKYLSREASKDLRREAGTNLLTEKIPVLTFEMGNLNNNLHLWVQKVIQRVRMVNLYNPQFRGNLLYTIKESLPQDLKTLLHCTNDLDIILTQIRIKLLTGRKAFLCLFHTNTYSKQEYFCLNNSQAATRAEQFLVVAKFALAYQVYKHVSSWDLGVLQNHMLCDTFMTEYNEARNSRLLGHEPVNALIDPSLSRIVDETEMSFAGLDLNPAESSFSLIDDQVADVAQANKTDLTAINQLREQEVSTPSCDFLHLVKYLMKNLGRIRQQAAIEANTPMIRQQTENRNRIFKGIPARSNASTLLRKNTTNTQGNKVPFVPPGTNVNAVSGQKRQNYIKLKCPCTDTQHDFIFRCHSFRGLGLEQRKHFISKNQACTSCLQRHVPGMKCSFLNRHQCASQGPDLDMSKRHNALLCPNFNQAKSANINIFNTDESLVDYGVEELESFSIENPPQDTPNNIIGDDDSNEPPSIDGYQDDDVYFYSEDIDNLNAEINLNFFQAVMEFNTPTPSEDENKSEYEGVTNYSSDTDETLLLTVSPSLHEELSSDEGLSIPTMTNSFSVGGQQDNIRHYSPTNLDLQTASNMGNEDCSAVDTFFKVPDIPQGRFFEEYKKETPSESQRVVQVSHQSILGREQCSMDFSSNHRVLLTTSDSESDHSESLQRDVANDSAHGYRTLPQAQAYDYRCAQEESVDKPVSDTSIGYTGPLTLSEYLSQLPGIKNTTFFNSGLLNMEKEEIQVNSHEVVTMEGDLIQHKFREIFPKVRLPQAVTNCVEKQCEGCISQECCVSYNQELLSACGVSERDAYYVTQGATRARHEILELLEVLLAGKIPATLGSLRLKSIGELLSYQFTNPHLNNNLLKVLVDIFNSNSNSKTVLPNIFQESSQIVSARLVVKPDPSGVSAISGSSDNDYFPMVATLENNIVDSNFKFYVNEQGFNSEFLYKAFKQCPLACLQEHSSAPYEPEMVRLMRGHTNPLQVVKDVITMPRKWAETGCAVCFRRLCCCDFYAKTCLQCNKYLHACFDLQACAFRPHNNLCICPAGREQVKDFTDNVQLLPIIHDYIGMKKTVNFYPKSLFQSYIISEQSNKCKKCKSNHCSCRPHQHEEKLVKCQYCLVFPCVCHFRGNNYNVQKKKAKFASSTYNKKKKKQKYMRSDKSYNYYDSVCVMKQQDMPVAAKNYTNDSFYPLWFSHTKLNPMGAVKVTLTFDLWLSLMMFKILEGLLMVKETIERTEHMFQNNVFLGAQYILDGFAMDVSWTVCATDNSIYVRFLFVRAYLLDQARITWLPNSVHTDTISIVTPESQSSKADQLILQIEELYTEIEKEYQEVDSLCKTLDEQVGEDISSAWSGLGEKTDSASADSTVFNRPWMGTRQGDIRPIPSICIYNGTVEDLQKVDYQSNSNVSVSRKGVVKLYSTLHKKMNSDEFAYRIRHLFLVHGKVCGIVGNHDQCLTKSINNGKKISYDILFRGILTILDFIIQTGFEPTDPWVKLLHNYQKVSTGRQDIYKYKEIKRIYLGVAESMRYLSNLEHKMVYGGHEIIMKMYKGPDSRAEVTSGLQEKATVVNEPKLTHGVSKKSPKRKKGRASKTKDVDVGSGNSGVTTGVTSHGEVVVPGVSTSNRFTSLTSEKCHSFVPIPSVNTNMSIIVQEEELADHLINDSLSNVICPVCNNRVSEDINAHLDRCLIEPGHSGVRSENPSGWVGSLAGHPKRRGVMSLERLSSIVLFEVIAKYPTAPPFPVGLLNMIQQGLSTARENPQQQNLDVATDTAVSGTQAVPRVPMPGASLESQGKCSNVVDKSDIVLGAPRSLNNSNSDLHLGIQGKGEISYRDCLLSCFGEKKYQNNLCEVKPISVDSWPKLDGSGQITKQVFRWPQYKWFKSNQYKVSMSDLISKRKSKLSPLMPVIIEETNDIETEEDEQCGNLMFNDRSDKLMNTKLDGVCENNPMSIADVEVAVAASDSGEDLDKVRSCIQITVPYDQDDAFILPPPPPDVCCANIGTLDDLDIPLPPPPSFADLAAHQVAEWPVNLQPTCFDWALEVEQVSVVHLNMLQINRLQSHSSSKRTRLHELSSDLARVPDDRGLTSFTDLSKRWRLINENMHIDKFKLSDNKFDNNSVDGLELSVDKFGNNTVDGTCSNISELNPQLSDKTQTVNNRCESFDKEFSTREMLISHVLQEAQTLNELLTQHNIRENIPIKGVLPIYIPEHNVRIDKLGDIPWEYKLEKGFYIFQLNFIYDSGCDLAVVRDQVCDFLFNFSFENRVISVPNQKPTNFRLPIVRAAIPNIGYVNFLGLKELPSYQNQGGTSAIIRNLMQIDNDRARFFNLDNIEKASRIDVLLPNTMKIVNYLEMEDIGLDKHPLLPNLRVARSVIDHSVIFFGSIYNHYPTDQSIPELVPDINFNLKYFLTQTESVRDVFARTFIPDSTNTVTSMLPVDGNYGNVYFMAQKYNDTCCEICAQGKFCNDNSFVPSNLCVFVKDNPSFDLSEEMEPFLNIGARCVKCRGCSICQSLRLLRKVPSNLDLTRQIAERLKLVQDPTKGNFIVYDTLFRYPIDEIKQWFQPKNSNVRHAFASTFKLIQKWKKNPIFVKNCTNLLREEEERGKISIIPYNSTEGQTLLREPHYFSYLNIVFNEDSKSSPVRVVIDGSRPVPFLKIATSELPVTGEDSMNSLLTAILVFRMYEVAFSLDIRKAWHCIMLEGIFNKLNLLAWFKNLDEIKEEMIILRHSGAFGYPQMNTIFELINAKFVSPRLMLESAITAVTKGRYCDNCSSSEPTVDEAVKAVDEITKAYENVGMFLKEPIIRSVGGQILVKEGQEKISEEVLYGMRWLLEEDLLFPTFVLTMNSKVRGRKVLPDLSECVPTLGDITRHKLYVLVATCASRDGLFTAPISLGLKALLSRACELTEIPKDYKTPLVRIDKDFTQMAQNYLQSITTFKDILPIKRCFIPNGYELVRLIGISDGGLLASGSLLYTVSTNTSSTYVQLIKASHKLGKRSVPVMEALSKSLLLDNLAEILPAFTRQINNKKQFAINLFSDSWSTNQLMNPARATISSPILYSNSRLQINVLKEISSNFPNTLITYSQIPSCLNVADLLTKVSNNSIEITNSAVYRHLEGKLNPLLECVENSTFLTVQDGSMSFDPLNTAGGVLDPNEENESTNLETCHILTCATCIEKKGDSNIDNILSMYQNDINVSALDNKTYVGKKEIRLDFMHLGEKIQELIWKNFRILNYTFYDYVQIFPLPPMTKSNYDMLVARYFTLPRLLNHVALLLLGLGPKVGNTKSKPCLIMEAWIAISTWSQLYYVCKIVGDRKTERHNNVLVGFKRRVSHIDKTQALPILSHSDPLTIKIVRHFHQMAWDTQVPTVRCKMHHSVNRTVRLVVSSNMGAFITNIRALVTSYSLSCGVCNITYKRLYLTESGTRIQNMTEEGSFVSCSLDILGPINLVPYLNARKKIKSYVLALCCLFTGELQFECIDSMTNESIIMGLKLLMNRRDVVLRYVYTDYFSSFQSLAKIKFQLHRLDGMGPENVLEFRPNKPYTKCRNVIERYVQGAKFYLRQATKAISDTNKGSLTYFQTNLLYSQIGSVLNSIPFNEKSKLAPGVLSRSELKSKDFDFPDSMMKLTDVDRVVKYYDILKNELSHFFQSDLDRVYAYLNKHSGIKMRPGDGVYFFKDPDDDNSPMQFGVLMGTKGSDVIVRVKNREVTVSKQRVHLYAPADQ